MWPLSTSALADATRRETPVPKTQESLMAVKAKPLAAGNLARRLNSPRVKNSEGVKKMLSTILIVLLILLLIGALPTWPYSAGWGYGPGGALGAILIIIVILALLGRI
jgi:hypothetical protein